jgi:hypothetical protein
MNSLHVFTHLQNSLQFRIVRHHYISAVVLVVGHALLQSFLKVRVPVNSLWYFEVIFFELLLCLAKVLWTINGTINGLAWLWLPWLRASKPTSHASDYIWACVVYSTHNSSVGLTLVLLVLLVARVVLFFVFRVPSNQTLLLLLVWGSHIAVVIIWLKRVVLTWFWLCRMLTCELFCGHIIRLLRNQLSYKFFVSVIFILHLFIKCWALLLLCKDGLLWGRHVEGRLKLGWR